MLEQTGVPLLTLGDRGKVKIFDGPTIRLNIKLESPDESNCPEFSYVYLIESKNNEIQPSEDPFAREEREESEHLQKIANNLNSKYGSTKKSKKRKLNISDLVDRGEGYCEDSFVDNSEAYDEVVPWCLDTKHGGFYINEGVLDFVRNEDSDLDDGQPSRKKEKLDDIRDGIKKKSKVGDQKKQKLKKKIKSDVTNKPCEEMKPSQASVANSELALQTEKSVPTTVIKAEQSIAEEEASELEESFSSNNIEEQNEDPTVSQLITELTCEIIQKVALARASQPPAVAGENQIPQLFSSGLMECLARLHSLCQTRKTEEKHSVFERIASACNCQKEQLYKKIKRYRMNLLLEELSKRKTELHNAISRVMPSLVEKYKHDLEESNKLKMMTKEVHGSGDSDPEDGDGKVDAEKGEKMKRIMAPRRKFIWSLEIRNLLCEVVSLKMRHFDMAKIKSQSAEEHLRSFLDSDIKPLWPSGWILTRALYKESRPAHANWTGDQSKVKKVLSTTPVHSATLLKTSLTQQQQQQTLPHQPTHTHNQQPQPVSAHKPNNATDEPIVINLDESDNESKAPATPACKPITKNAPFTQIKDKPSQEANKSEVRPHPNMLMETAVGTHVHVASSDKDANEIPFGGNVMHSIPATFAVTRPSQTKDLQACQKNASESPPKFVCPNPLQPSEGKDQSKQEHVFFGKFISSSSKSIPTNPTSQTNVKSKPNPILEESGNIFVGLQTLAAQGDFQGNSQSQMIRKRTLSQTCPGQFSDATHSNIPAAPVTKVLIETSSMKQVPQRNAFDNNNQNQGQKNATNSWEGGAYQQIQQASPSHLYQQQLLQQQYQQFQQHKQQMKKSPKLEKPHAAQMASTNCTAAQQQQQPNFALPGIKSVHPQSNAPKPDVMGDVLVQDYRQDPSRSRPNESPSLQRGLPPGAQFLPSNEVKLNFQKSPTKKEVGMVQNQGFAFQNLSPQNKQQVQQMLLKSQQNQNSQQSFKHQQPLDQIAPHPRHVSPQVSSQQPHMSLNYSQPFFRGQNFTQDGNTHQKN